MPSREIRDVCRIMSDQRLPLGEKNTYIACHLVVVPIHIRGTFTLADNGGKVSIEPGAVWSETQHIG